MGLPLARIGSAIASPGGVRVAVGFVGGAALATGTIIATQYAYGEDLSKATGIPNPISWQAGIPIGAGVIGAVTGAVLARPGEYRAAWKGGAMLAGAGLGVAAGTLLLTPLARHVMADS
jgi:hypothetical protein